MSNRGGTHGSPADPLLLRAGRSAASGPPPGSARLRPGPPTIQNDQERLNPMPNVANEPAVA